MNSRLTYHVGYSFEEVDDVRTWQNGFDAETELDSREYWQLAGELINAWAQYQAKKKLFVNATHEETWHKVWDVIVKNYDGDVRRVRRHEQKLSIQVDIKLNNFDRICGKFKVEPVSRQWLYENLKDSKDYASYRGKCDRRKAFIKPAESLKDI